MFFQPGNLIVSSYLSHFQWVGKPQISKFRQQGTIIEPLLYFPIWSPAQDSTGSMIIYDAAPEAEGRWPKSRICLEPPSLFWSSAALTGGWDSGVTGQKADGREAWASLDWGGPLECRAAPGLAPDQQPGPHPVAGVSRE